MSETQELCVNCAMYRAGSKPYCAKTGKRIVPTDPLPTMCSVVIRARPI